MDDPVSYGMTCRSQGNTATLLMRGTGEEWSVDIACVAAILLYTGSIACRWSYLHPGLLGDWCHGLVRCERVTSMVANNMTKPFYHQRSRQIKMGASK